jgi:SAM-dependent methyltransferase
MPEFAVWFQNVSRLLRAYDSPMDSDKPPRKNHEDHEEHQHHHHHHHHGDVQLDSEFWAASAAQTELEGEVLIDFVTRTAERVRALHPGPVQRIADIGSGPGVAVCALAEWFPGATVVAIDGSSAMLERAGARAQRLGLKDRVETLVAVLPDGLNEVAPVDVLWASMSLHHVGDEVAALRDFRKLLAPNGVVAITEFGDPLRSLPHDLGIGEPGLADRLQAAQSEWFALMRAGLPESVVSADLATMVGSAGLSVLSDEIVRIRIDEPLRESERKWLVGNFRRTRDHFHDRLDPADLAVLDILLDEHNPLGIMNRADVFIEASRQIVLAN